MFYLRVIKLLMFVVLGLISLNSLAIAAPLKPTSLTWTVPAGSNNTGLDGTSTKPYKDDVLLETLVFNGFTYERSESSFVRVLRAMVLTNRDAINAEYGDLDSNSDGNATPFVKAGIIPEGTALPDATRESVDPAIQDAAIAHAFDSFSLVEGVDGEGANYSMRLIFDKGIVDNSLEADFLPELVFFERGSNSSFSIRAIIGGTWDAPTYAPLTVSILTTNLWASNLYIDTIEIGSGQRLGVAGIDLNDFWTAGNAPEAVFGYELTSLNSSGADVYGQFMSAESWRQFVNLPDGLAIPEPGSIALFGLGFGVLVLRRRKRV